MLYSTHLRTSKSPLRTASLMSYSIKDLLCSVRLQRTSGVRTAFNTVSASTITTLFVIVYCCFFYPVLEHGSPKHRQMCLDHIMSDLLDYATNEQGYKSVTKALKETGPETLDRIVKRMCEPAKGYERCDRFLLRY